MDEKQQDFIVLAGLIHDIGKLLERGEVFSESRKDETYLEFCPRDKKGGFHTHLHCTHTKCFCDELEQKFTCLRTSSSNEWKTWASGHHLNDEQSFGAKVIRIADRLSSSEREEGQYYQKGIGQRTLLEPVIEKVFLHNNDDKTATSYRYPLSRIRSDDESLFPKFWKDFPEELIFDADAHEGLEDPTQWSHLLTKKTLKDEYQKLCQSFLEDIDALARKNSDISLRNLTICLSSILERYTANVPSATNVRHPDISLFDHMRTTASIAQALYIEQSRKQNCLADLEIKNDSKWLLVCGDFSGIQKFIYNLTNQGAAKGLRGRSYYVQLFCSLSSRYLLRELDLNPAALLYDSGGKFYILIPSCLKDDLYVARKSINSWLLNKFGGSVYMGLGIAPVTSDMFAQGNMHEAWKAAAEDLEKDRTGKFRDFLHEQDFFEPQVDFNPTVSCPVCGTRMVHQSIKCSLCEQLEKLGLWLRDTEAVLTVWNAKAGVETSSIFNSRKIIIFDDLDAAVILISSHELSNLRYLKTEDAECIFYNESGEKDIKHLDLPGVGVALQFSYLGRWDMRRQMDENQPWDFQRYADESQGIKRIGLLRMDVDNLGLIFMQGLYFPQRESLYIKGKSVPGWGNVVVQKGQPVRRPMASISRMTTLSRQLKNFFSGYLVNLLKKDSFDKCQIIYSGGDDLFVIGSWHQLPELAQTVQDKFSAFCCHNQDMGISGGITLHRGKYPIYKAAQLAGAAEKKAKMIRSDWINTVDLKKSGFCFQNTAILWEDWQLAQKIIHLLEKESQDSNKGFSSFLRQMTAGNQTFSRKLMMEKNISHSMAWKEIAFYPWHWRTKYQLKRRYKNQTDQIEKWAEVLFDQGKISEMSQNKNNGAALPVFSWLELPLTIADYLHR
ncbi:type III-A CRISPR-associated protein Cas10/Csm1 [Desulfonatronovibrio magnus]|uniref:type III-A CRISPR-associated protein Cas10/Csm1 n=1 Tax=Desulfonatronovibrio magnus TaxID=698827 RepID=UPI0005EBEC0B|nr:type III-A CRISPR-associated protein Cas10/Csm1 [Desulfonatronovibrio magnus]